METITVRKLIADTAHYKADLPVYIEIEGYLYSISEIYCFANEDGTSGEIRIVSAENLEQEIKL